ncbi:hypothetical protein ACT17_06440 [Mycolicibacterium conceptionense]|uniref:Uncharacterized protein n=1 Tax=Mycolicibacterium conceptionense TaxID=451644 RepID=A0A0J8UH27_9MYCO|nr:hypothetical protein [Mycolicibacterium conceptionense]KMV19670.1 hypothetical protein ACT17_06440 [Mycolicibacterium conceptionense]
MPITYTATDTIPAGMVRPGHIINAQEIFAQWPANTPILSPLDALGDDDPVASLRFLTVTAVRNDGPDIVVFNFRDGDFGVMSDQPVRIFEEA